MHWIAVFLIGLIIGLLARALTPGHGPRGIILTALLGIAGSIVGTWAGQTLGWYAPGRPAGFIASVVGAMLLLLLHRMLARQS
ncbi:transglycosylase-associated protein [mine drainage metagenome]|uniref:Transglycosylase-associated protein n=1 Tax=mine drainage metagenome TaxID=410659 RepID=T0Z6Z9_9ZZZZ